MEDQITLELRVGDGEPRVTVNNLGGAWQVVLVMNSAPEDQDVRHPRFEVLLPAADGVAEAYLRTLIDRAQWALNGLIEIRER